MKAFNLISKLAWTVTSGLVVCTLAFGALAASPLPAFAASGPTATATAAQDRDGSLARAFERETAALRVQETRLDKAAKLADKVRDWINKLNAKGVDTAALQAALTTFKAQLASAQDSHRAARDILTTHAGFDANGHVIDRDAARQTVLSAGQSLRDAHNILKQVAADLRAAIKEWRGAHPHSTPAHAATPTATPTK